MVVCDLGNPMKAGTKVRFDLAGAWQLTLAFFVNHSSDWAGGLQEFKIRSSKHLAGLPTHLVTSMIIGFNFSAQRLKGVFMTPRRSLKRSN